MTSLNIDLVIDGPHNNVTFKGPRTDVTGTIDLTGVVGPVEVTFTLPQGFTFTGLQTCESSMFPPHPHAPNGEFSHVRVGGSTLSFDYLNTPKAPYQVYQLLLKDPSGVARTIDPYIKNGG